jgi:hypothetical protein
MPHVSVTSIAQLVRIVTSAAVNRQRLIPMWISHLLMSSALCRFRQHKQRKWWKRRTAGAWMKQPWQHARQQTGNAMPGSMLSSTYAACSR